MLLDDLGDLKLISHYCEIKARVSYNMNNFSIN